jgi:MFS family permease
LSQLADGLYQIALASIVVFGVEAAETPGQVTKVLAVTTIPFSLVGPFTGPFIDRFSRRSLLVGSKLAMVVVTVALIPASGAAEAVILGLAVVNISINRFFHAAKNAALPSLVEPRQYLLANAVSSTVGMVFGLTGAVAGGPLADAFAPALPLVMAGVCLAGSAVFASTLRLPGGEKRGLTGIAAELRQDLRDVADGLRVLLSSRQATYGVVAIWSMRALLGLILLASLVLLRARFDIQATGFSTVFAALGVGGFLGAVLVPLLARRTGYLGVAPVALVLAGLATVIGGPIPSLAALLPTVLLGGVAVSLTKISSDTLVQRAIPDRYRGRAFTVYELGYNGAFVVAGLIPTALRPAIGDLGVILLTSSLALAVAAALWRWRRRIPEPIEVRTYAGSRGDEVPREVVIGGHALRVDDVERSWHEERAGDRLLCFRLRLADGSRMQISFGETWALDRRL